MSDQRIFHPRLFCCCPSVLKRFSRNRRGSVLIEAAILIPFVMGFTLAAVEFGFLYMEKMAARNYVQQMSQTIAAGLTNIAPVATQANADKFLSGDFSYCARSFSLNGATPDCALGSVVTTRPAGTAVGAPYNVFIKMQVNHDRMTPVGNLLKFALPTAFVEKTVAKYNETKPNTACNQPNQYLQFDGQNFRCTSGTSVPIFIQISINSANFCSPALVENDPAGVIFDPVGGPLGGFPSRCPANTTPRLLLSFRGSETPGSTWKHHCLWQCIRN